MDSDEDETGFFEIETGNGGASRPGGSPATAAPPPDATALVGEPTRSGAEDAAETQMLETQVVSREELDMLRGAHLRRQKRRLALRGAILLLALSIAAGLYWWLSAEKVSRFLSGQTLVHMNRVIRDDAGGSVSMAVPNWRGGADSGWYRWDSMLGEDGKVPFAALRARLFGRASLEKARARAFRWTVPYFISITNWTDEASLREDRLTTFERWWSAQDPSMRRDRDYSPPPLFLGGECGSYPGVRCLERKYYRVDASGDNFVGTVVFFRHGARCHVLRRELPAEEEGRGWAWLGNVWTTLYAPARNSDGTENLFAACHWEGSPLPDSAREPALLLDDSRKALEREDSGAWGDVERDLSLALRAVHGRTDPDSAAVRSGALDALRRLRAAQREFWNKQRLVAVKTASVRGDMDSVRAVTAARFPSADDERHYLVQREAWWTLRPLFGGER